MFFKSVDLLPVPAKKYASLKIVTLKQSITPVSKTYIIDLYHATLVY